MGRLRAEDEMRMAGGGSGGEFDCGIMRRKSTRLVSRLARVRVDK
jgi:hypothetical protein